MLRLWWRRMMNEEVCRGTTFLFCKTTAENSFDEQAAAPPSTPNLRFFFEYSDCNPFSRFVVSIGNDKMVNNLSHVSLAVSSSSQPDLHA